MSIKSRRIMRANEKANNRIARVSIGKQKVHRSFILLMDLDVKTVL